MSILLIDEEIPYKPDNDNNEFYGDIGARDKSIYLEGAKAQLKEVMEYLKERWNGTEFEFYNIVAIPKDEWKALLKEVE